MAFMAGWQTENHDGMQFGKDIVFDCPDHMNNMREVWRTSDKSWEAAKGKFRLEETNKWNAPTFVHVFAFEMVQCDSVCWRIGVAHEEFPVNDLWSWFKTLEVGEAPPWGVFMAGGKTELAVYPPSILKAGETKLNKDYRDPQRVVPIAPRTVLDGAGRVRLRKGDIVGVCCDMGKNKGNCKVSFYINSILMHEPLHLYCTPGEKWVPFVCLGNTQVRVRMHHPSEIPWDIKEEQEIRKADIAWEKGEPVFEGAGWLSRQQGITGTWVRSWYQLGFEDLLYAPNPKVFIKVHCAKDLEAMDINGSSDPYVKIMVGEHKFDVNKKRGLLSMFGGGDTFLSAETSKKKTTLNPEWNEFFELAVNNIDGWISFLVFDHDLLSKDDLIGAHFIRLKDVENASYKASTLRKYQSQWVVLKQDDGLLPTGKLQVSVHVGQDKPSDTLGKKSMFKRIVSASTDDKVGRLRLESMSRVRRGNRDTELVVDYASADHHVKPITFRVDADIHLQGWLTELHKAVCRRTMGGKARRRAIRLLGENRAPRDNLDDPILEIDPSNFHEFGFSRMARFWKDHPLKQFAGMRANSKLSFELQFTDADVIELSKPLSANMWCTSLRLDCFAFPGYIGDTGAKILAESLKDNTCLQELNLRGNRIGDPGATELGGMLRKNRRLQRLNLDGNQLTKQGAIKMLSCIMGDATYPANQVLKELNLQFNKIPELESGIVCNCHVTADII